MVARADLGRALKAGTAAARLLPSQTDPLLAVFARLTLARVLAECGLYARAIDWLDEAEKIAVTGKMTYLADWARVVAAAAHLHLGNPAEADRRLAPAARGQQPDHSNPGEARRGGRGPLPLRLRARARAGRRHPRRVRAPARRRPRPTRCARAPPSAWETRSEPSATRSWGLALRAKIGGQLVRSVVAPDRQARGARGARPRRGGGGDAERRAGRARRRRQQPRRSRGAARLPRDRRAKRAPASQGPAASTDRPGVDVPRPLRVC
jgi:hypothetical protein